MADLYAQKRAWDSSAPQQYAWPPGPPDKRQRTAPTGQQDSAGGGAMSRTNSSQGDPDGDASDDDDEGMNGKSSKLDKDGKPKVKLTRGSRACGQCRRLKMKCLPDEAGGPCKRCRFGGHECVFEESNRGKRSTRKAEALANRIAKLETALRHVGSALTTLDRTSLASFSSMITSVETDPETLDLLAAASVPLAGHSHLSRSQTPAHAESYTRMAGRLEPSSADQESFDRFMGADGAHEKFPQSRGYPGVGHPSTGQEGSASSESRRLHSLPDNTLSPLGLLAEASLHEPKRPHGPSPLGEHPMTGTISNMTNHSSPLKPVGDYKTATSDVRGGDNEDDSRGVASTNYFKPPSPGPGDSQQQPPQPELFNIVTREEIDEMFAIFFDKMAIHVPLLIRDFHTPQLVLQRSQFLICAVAARFHPKRPELHGQLSAYAKRLAFDVPARGYKSVEVVQAYLLLTVWTLGPEKTFEQDRTWLMLGMAIRMATDLNLHRKSVTSSIDTEEGHIRDREILNRERCWLHCFVLDRSLSVQMGKPYTIREDYIIRNSCEASWLNQRFSLPSDTALAAFVNLQQIMSRAIDHIYSSTSTASGLRPDCDYPVVIRSAMEDLTRWLVEWNRAETFDRLGSRGVNEYDSRAQFYYQYSALVLYSFGLQNALERRKTDLSFFFVNVYESATKVCNLIRDGFSPKGHLSYLPDSNFVQTSYALLSLLKLTKPEVKPYHDSEEAIYKLVSDIADVLEGCAVDPSHQPAIYAAFIREIIRKTRESPKENGTVDQQVLAVPMGELQGAHYDNQPLVDPSGMWNPQAMSHMGMPMNSGTHSHSQFGFVHQGGDMMILPSAAGPSQSAANSMQNSPVSYPSFGTPAGWAEYNPTFMGMDGLDGWDGSMLMPGFGRGQITLSGGLLHSQYGSGIMTPAAGPTPSQSRAQTPSHHSNVH